MDQTPVHDKHNADLLKVIPQKARRLVEIGCSSGSLAREFKKLAPDCDYLGIEIEPRYAELARRHCDRTLVLDIEKAGDEFWAANSDRDCWIFGDSLEHLRDPWETLRKVRATAPPHAVVAACIPNAQHWSLQVSLNSGAFRYSDQGLLDRTHLRWFTRKTILEMFANAGFEITQCNPRLFNESGRDRFLPLIEEMAELAGVNAKQAVMDCMPLQYVIAAALK